MSRSVAATGARPSAPDRKSGRNACRTGKPLPICQAGGTGMDSEIQARKKLDPAEIGAIAHLYRGEVYRSTIWRTRLDTSTNWSVTLLFSNSAWMALTVSAPTGAAVVSFTVEICFSFLY